MSEDEAVVTCEGMVNGCGRELKGKCKEKTGRMKELAIGKWKNKKADISE